VLFYPHKLDSSTGGNNWECDLAPITSVGLSARGSNPFNGSMRRPGRYGRDDAAPTRRVGWLRARTRGSVPGTLP